MACKDWHDLPPGPAAWRTVETIEKGRFPELFVAFLTTSGYHCAKPTCASACPVGAVTKRSRDGVMVVNQEKCLGKVNCDVCLQACPYDAPQFGQAENAKIEMCNFCPACWSKSRSPSV